MTAAPSHLSSGTATVPVDPTKEMAVAGRKALALVADRMEEAKLLATSSIDFWQRVGHEPANEIYKVMIEARPATSPTPQIAGGVREALEPFAKIAAIVEYTDSRDGEIVHRQHDRAGNRVELTKDDFRRAVRVLAALSPQAQAGAVAQGQSDRGEVVMWVCLVPNPLGELRIRAWTADRKRMESLQAEGLDMQPLYASPAALPAGEPNLPTLDEYRNNLVEECAKIAETVYSRMFPKPANRITAENAGHAAAAAIRALAVPSTTMGDAAK